MLAIYKALRRRGADALIATHGARTKRCSHEGVLIRSSASAERGRSARFVCEAWDRTAQSEFYSTANAQLRARRGGVVSARRDVVCGVTDSRSLRLLSTRWGRYPAGQRAAGSWVPPVFSASAAPASSPPGPLFSLSAEVCSEVAAEQGRAGA